MIAPTAAATIGVVLGHHAAKVHPASVVGETAPAGPNAVTADPGGRHKVAKTGATALEAQDLARAGDAINATRASGMNRRHHCPKSASHCCPMTKASNRWRAK